MYSDHSVKSIEIEKPTSQLLVELCRRVCRSSPQRTVLVVAMMVILGLVESATVFGLMPVLQNLKTQPLLLAGYMLLVTVLASLREVQSIQMSLIQHQFSRQESERLAAALIRSHWNYLNQLKLADITHALTTEIYRLSFVVNQLITLVQQCLLSVIFMFAAFYLSPSGALLTILSGLLLVAAMRKLHANARKIGNDSIVVGQQFSHFVVEQMSGLKTVKSHGLVQEHIERFIDVAKSVETQQICAVRASARVRMWFSIGGAFLFGMVLYVEVVLVKLSTTEILTLLFLFARLFPRISSLQQSFYIILHSLSGFASLLQFQKESEEHVEAITLSNERYELQQEIRISSEGFELVIPVNSLTAIIGPSGAGKTTMIDAIVGFYRLPSQVVYIDGQRLNADLLSSWRRSIGYLTQDPFLFNDTIKANLLWGNSDCDESELWKILECAAAKDFVEKLPAQLNTVVGDRGTLLSGGERQRIALTRVLLRRPSLLILDEVTNSLDVQNQELIRTTIESLHGKLTIVVVTHQEDFVRQADQVVKIGK